MYLAKDIRKIGQQYNPFHVLHLRHQWGVDFGEEEKDFFTEIIQTGEDFALGQPPDLGMKEQLLEVSNHLIAEDGEETGIHGT